MSWPSRRRFWSRASVAEGRDGFVILLDTRPLNTPSQRPLEVRTAACARGIADEWDALDDRIEPARLPLTRAANTAVDRVAPQRSAVVDALADYGGSDLLCYRAEAPGELVRRQAAAWDPWLAWSRDELGAPLTAVVGVMHRPQPPASLDVLHREVDAHDAFALTALHELVTVSGSLVLGLAVSRGALAAADAWPLSRVDETWQAEQWGVDAEAEAAADARRRDFLRAEALLRLLHAGGQQAIFRTE